MLDRKEGAQLKKKKKIQIKIVKWLMLIFCFVGSTYLMQSSFLYPNAPIKAAKKTDLGSGEVKVSKTAEPVAGMVNQWDITLRIEGRNQVPPPPVDVVLIIDTSGSMKDNDRMAKAKVAAERFVNLVLRNKYANRIALISYDETVTSYTFNKSSWSGQFVDAAHKDLLIDKIRELAYATSTSNGGAGTFTQAAIKSATKIMESSTGEKRNIVLVSDGVPTFSYPPTEPYNQLKEMEYFDYKNGDAGYDYYQSVKTIPKGYFDYSKKYGSGARYLIGAFAPEYEAMPKGSKQRLMANHANSTIAEANITKQEKRANGDLLVTDFYTIGVDLDSDSQNDEIKTGNQTLKEIASSEEKCFSATANNLDDILGGIAGSIVGATKNGLVDDPLGTGFEIEGEVTATQGDVEVTKIDGKPKISWNVGALKTAVSTDPDEDVMYAELKYRVNATNDVLQTKVIDGNGEASTNGLTIFKYTDFKDAFQTMEFLVPKVKPIIVSLQKELLDEKGTELPNKTEQFTFKYSGDALTNQDNFSIYPNEVKKIVHPWKADKDYTIDELLKPTQEYETKINVNGQVSSGTKAIFKFTSPIEKYKHQEINVTNQLIAKEKTVTLHLRQSVIQPNDELVIPSKGYFSSSISEPNQKLNLVSGSTTKDTPAEVGEELFTSYKIVFSKKQPQKLNLWNLIPEYYEFFGFIATDSGKDLGQKHLSSNSSDLIKKNEAVLDYEKSEEYWVTMFIVTKLGTDSNQNKEESPRPYSWSYKTNKFGK